MKYIDIFKKAYAWSPHEFGLSWDTEIEYQEYWGLNRKVLAWASHHEHAVFSILDEVHPASVFVWFQWRFRGLCYGDSFSVIYKIQQVKTIMNPSDIRDDWTFAEHSQGNIPFVNNNPFDPRKNNAASNTAESVFPQNKGINYAKHLRAV